MNADITAPVAITGSSLQKVTVGDDVHTDLPPANQETGSPSSENDELTFDAACRALPFRERWIQRVTINPELQPDDPSLQGFVFQAGIGALTSSGTTPWAKLLSVSTTFLLHQILETQYFILPCVAIAYPTTLTYWYMSFYRDRAPDFEGPMVELQYNDRSALRRFWVTCIAWTVLAPMFFAYFACMTCSLFAWRPQFRLICVWGSVCMFASFVMTVAAVTLKSKALFLPAFLACIIYLFIHFFSCARFFSIPVLKAFAIPNLAGVLIVFCIRSTYEKILSGSDSMKAIFVVFVNPLLTELLMILPGRVLGRCLRHNHPSSAFTTGIFLLNIKQILGRTMVCMIADQKFVLIVSICNMITEFCMRVSLRKRDAMFYKSCLSRSRSSHPTHVAKALGDHASTTILRHNRSRMLRAHNAMLETLGEILAIVNGSYIVCLWDISLDGVNPVNYRKVMQGALTQIGLEFLTDYVTAVALRFDGIPIMEIAKGRRFIWCVPIAIAAWLGNGCACAFILTRSFCLSPSFDAAAYRLCLTAQNS